jgi:hypothetical protein
LVALHFELAKPLTLIIIKSDHVKILHAILDGMPQNFYIGCFKRFNAVYHLNGVRVRIPPEMVPLLFRNM